MSQRTVFIKDGGPHTPHECTANTFGELKKELGGKVDFGGKRAMRVDNSQQLGDTDSIPQEDFAIHLFPIATKGGN